MRAVGERVAVSVLLPMLVAANACGTASDGAGTTRVAASEEVQALRLSAKRTPPVGLRHYRTRGTYPQVSGGDQDLDAVNAALAAAVRRDQRDYVLGIQRDDRRGPPAGPAARAG